MSTLFKTCIAGSSAILAPTSHGGFESEGLDRVGEFSDVYFEIMTPCRKDTSCRNFSHPHTAPSNYLPARWDVVAPKKHFHTSFTSKLAGFVVSVQERAPDYRPEIRIV